MSITEFMITRGKDHSLLRCFCDTKWTSLNSRNERKKINNKKIIIMHVPHQDRFYETYSAVSINKLYKWISEVNMHKQDVYWKKLVFTTTKFAQHATVVEKRKSKPKWPSLLDMFFSSSFIFAFSKSIFGSISWHIHESIITSGSASGSRSGSMKITMS